MRDGGSANSLVEQNAKRALALADRAIVMQRGQIKLAGTARDIERNEALSTAYLAL